jgi:hypothetical protein
VNRPARSRRHGFGVGLSNLSQGLKELVSSECGARLPRSGGHRDSGKQRLDGNHHHRVGRYIHPKRGLAGA